GLLYAIGPNYAYGTTVILLIITSLVVLFGVARQGRPGSRGPAGWDTRSAGFRDIWTRKPILGAISLDLFAVLFGGAMALLPVYARDILDVGPEGLGLLRAGPAIGAIIMGVLSMMRPIRNHAGIIMFIAVAGF